MANLHSEAEETPANQAPLLTAISNSNSNSNSNQNHVHIQAEEGNDSESETQLDQTLRRLETFLALLGFKQSSVLSFALSWTAFVVVGVVIPLTALRFCDCSDDCENYQIKDFEMDVVAFQACLAAVSLMCLSHNLRKYGLRRFLFVDRYSGQTASFHDDYVRQISVSEFKFLFYLSACG